MGQANNGKATASLVLGIISIVCVMGTFYTSWIGLIILGNKARKETPGGIATAGFVCGIVGTALCALSFAGCMCVAGLLGQAVTYWHTM